ncbi:universal stress protein [Bacillus sp. FJAT-45350]|uniref:universal stress protein n=1 Tax=Bacillus sp. FJAT-45350 TaxID=2011014 RepID=UPI000BB7F796|nr:universal stress protein [Bacillus sp. FJAT-45350]
MSFKKVLVAIDGSNNGYRTLQKAIEHVQDVSGELTLVHIAKSHDQAAPIMLGHSTAVEYNLREKMQEAEQEQGKEVLNIAVEDVKKAGLTCETVLLEGDAARELTKYAENERFDMIMIGSRGLGTFKELMLGSVSHKVSQISTIPVLIVK